LQRKHRLRARQRIERHAPLHHLDQVVGIHAAQLGSASDRRSFSWRCGASLGGALHAGIDAGANGVDVGPGPHGGVAPVHLGRGKARRVHGADEVALLGQHLARGAKVDHHRLVVVGDEDVGRLDVQVQHLVLVHDAQAAQHSSNSERMVDSRKTLSA
jgi:hypothetical protein